MTVLVTRNVSGRFRGFISSCMLEIAPGVYTSPNMSAGVRDRLWTVLEEWYRELMEEASIIMTWKDSTVASGQKVRVLGSPPVELVYCSGLILSYRELKEDQKERE